MVLIITGIRVPGNVAYGKSAVQTGAWAGLTANKAVDGMLDSDGIGNQYCAHPYADRGPAQWTADLQDNHRLYSITIYNTEHSKFSFAYYKEQ